MSLRTRIVTLIALVLLVSLLLGVVVAGAEARRTLREELNAALRGGAQAVASAFEDLPRSDRRDRGLRQLVATFDGDRHLRVRLVDERGRTLAISSPAQPPETAPDWFAALLGAPPAPTRLAAPANDGGAAWIELQPVSAPDVSAVWREALRALAILALMAAIGLALAFLAIGAAVRPLRRMSTALARIGEGDYGVRASEEGPPELVDLQRAFNRMAGQLASMQGRNRQLEAQLATIQDEERAEIARDLHDDMGPHLFSVTIDAQIVAGLVGSEAPEVGERLRAIQQAVAHMQRLVRDLLGRLRPTPVTELGLAPAIDDLVAFWTARRAEVEIHLALMDEATLPEPVKDTAFRIIQEALSNAMRHAAAKAVTVRLQPLGEREVEVVVADDGRGAGAAAGGFGLIGIRERVQALGGQLRIDRGDGARGGWTVTARLPLHPEVRAAAAEETA